MSSLNGKAKELAAHARLGRLIIPLSFGGHHGRRLPSIISRSGRIYKPGPYDVPSFPFKVLAFALNMVLAMIDSNLLPKEWFGSAGIELHVYREHTLRLLRRLESDMRDVEPEDSIEYQPNTELKGHTCSGCTPS